MNQKMRMMQPALMLTLAIMMVMGCRTYRSVGPQPGDVQAVDLGGGVWLGLVWCPPGKFWMGSPESEVDRGNDERQHRVTLTKGFWMGKYEVTQAQWEAVMGRNPSQFRSVGPNAPVERVSWNDCQMFVRKLNEMLVARGEKGGFRLPTEAEWEYACRAGTRTPFHYGGDLDATMANCCGDHPYGKGHKGEYRQITMRVGSFLPNAWGLYDMHGNIFEWCQDRFADYPRMRETDPIGPDSGPYRVLRGGCWCSAAWGCRSARRDRDVPDRSDGYLGFRLARDS